MRKLIWGKNNENYVHACDSGKVEISSYKRSIAACNYTLEELKVIYDFYLANTPAKKDSTEKAKNIRWLGDYGWKSSQDLQNLERLLLKSADINSFCILKSDSIDETLKSMNLSGEMCIEHPRCVIKLAKKVTVLENGEFKITPDEKRLVCLFRHIRNALAHGQTYVFDNGYILLEDEDNGKIVSRILLKQKTLMDWVYVVDKDNKYYPLRESQKRTSENKEDDLSNS